MTTIAHLQTLTAAAIDRAHTRFPDLVLDRDLPVLSFKSSRALGRCQVGASVAGARRRVVSISYNLPAVALLPEAEVLELVAHEVAHAVAATLYSDLSHGWRWKSICSALGGDAKRVYTCDTETLAALKAVMAPAKRVRYFEWLIRGEKIWRTGAAHARGVRIMASALKGVTGVVEMSNVLTRTGTPTGQEVLSATPPASMPLSAAA